MAKNSLGELENAPGAARRERAKVKRDAVKAFNEVVKCNEAHAENLRANARLNDHYADVSYLARGEMKKAGFEYRAEARESFEKVAKLEQEVKDLKKQARQYKWGARKDSVVAFCQTWAAKAKKLAP